MDVNDGAQNIDLFFRSELEGLERASAEKEQEADTMTKMIAKLEKSIAR